MNRSMCILLFIFFAGCASENGIQMNGDAQPKLGCAGSDPYCAAVMGAMMIMGDKKNSGSGSDKLYAKTSIFGRCEILQDNDIPAGQKHPRPHPCEHVELKLTNKSNNEVRTAWVDGFDFEIPGLAGEQYLLEAFAEKYHTHARLDALKPGRPVQIQIQLAHGIVVPN